MGYVEDANGGVQDVAGDEWLMLKKETEVTCVDLSSGARVWWLTSLEKMRSLQENEESEGT